MTPDQQGPNVNQEKQEPPPFSFDVEGAGWDQGVIKREVGEAQPGEEQDGNE